MLYQLFSQADSGMLETWGEPFCRYDGSCDLPVPEKFHMHTDFHHMADLSHVVNLTEMHSTRVWLFDST